ncbi:MAG: cyclic nucleotide-binding domain-containing protein [Alphaproteobacteria bacterium]
MAVADDLQIMKHNKGDRIITQGEKSDKAYMILSGRVRVYLEDGTKVVDLAELGEDEIFGESAIFNGGAYGANVDALEDCELYVITPQALTNMLGSADPIIRALLQMLITRLKATNEALLKSETREFMDIALI